MLSYNIECTYFSRILPLGRVKQEITSAVKRACLIAVILSVSIGGGQAQAFDDCNGNGVDDASELGGCPPIDLVFLIDTSDSNVANVEDLCTAINDAVNEMVGDGLVVNKEVLSISSGLACSCCEDSVAARYGTSTPGIRYPLGSDCSPFYMPAGAFEDWGPATAVVAGEREWEAGLRVIIPMSDEGARCGDTIGAIDYLDTEAASNAANIAYQNRVTLMAVIDADDLKLAKHAQLFVDNGAFGGKVLWLQDATSTLASNFVAAIRFTCPKDCNNNGIFDQCDLASGHSCDTNLDEMPDECVACCENGDCSNVPSTSCSGTSYAGITCDDCTCTMGGCCNDESCDQIVDCECVQLGGQPLVSYSSCPFLFNPCLTGACCSSGVCHDETIDGELMDKAICTGPVGGNYIGGGSCSETAICIPYDPCSGSHNIIGSDPISMAIDARYPHAPNDQTQAPYGWDSIDVEFDSSLQILFPGDFTITTTNDTPISIVSVSQDLSTATLQFDRPIIAGEWTTIVHTCSCDQICLGFLPGDVNGDGVTSPNDILTLIDHLIGIIPPLDLWQCDLDRSGVCSAPDILALIDLLNGASEFTVWNNVSLPESPCGTALAASCSQCDAPTVFGAGSRYLGVSVPDGPDAIRLQVTCPDGLAKYVGIPDPVTNIALLVDRADSAFLTPQQWGSVVYLTGEEIAPSAAYEVRMDFMEDVTSSYQALGLVGVGSTYLWGDTGNDGDVDFFDINCVVQGFLGNFSGACTIYATDLRGGASPTTIDGIVDFFDISACVNAFLDTPYPCGTGCANSCPLNYTVVGGPGASITLSPGSATILPNDVVVVDVLVSGVTSPIQSYQVAVNATGGTAGDLNLDAVAIDTSNIDYIFNGASSYPATDLLGARLANSIGSAGVVPADGAYLGTFTFRAGPLADGAFTINIDVAQTVLSSTPDDLVQVDTLNDSSIQVSLGGCSPACSSGDMCCDGACQECCTDNDCAKFNVCCASAGNVCKYPLQCGGGGSQ